MHRMLSLNVFMHKHKPKVIFAEAESEFVDTLLSFLALPLATMNIIVDDRFEPRVFGSLANLWRSFHHDDDGAIKKFSKQRGDSISMLLHPISSLADDLARIKLDIAESCRTKYYFCRNPKCAEPAVTFVKMENEVVYMGDAAACDCGMKLESEECVSFGEGKLTTDDLSFIIFDDLRVLPNVHGFRPTLQNLGIADLDDVEMVTWDLDLLNIEVLFKLAMFSATPLTDFAIYCTGKKTGKEIMNYCYKISTAANSDLFHFPEKNLYHTTMFLNMTLTVSLQKSTNIFLYALARSEVLEFLLSLLAIPLGGVEYLFGGNTAFKCIGNLYRSVRDEIDYKYFVKPRIRQLLIDPKLPYGYKMREQFLIAAEETPPPIYVGREKNRIYLSYENKQGKFASFKLRNSNACFVKANTMCTVSDDLSVTPYSIASTMKLLKDMEIPLWDVKEMDFLIGYDEALRILKAALKSNTVFTDALVNPMLMKNMKNQPKDQLP